MSPSDPAVDALLQAISALQSQRGLLGDAVVDAALAPLHQKLAALQATRQPAPRRSAAAANDRPGQPQRLRQVSVLFLDVVGSTAISRSADPEDIHAIMDAALQAFTQLVQQRGGKVLQYAGDSLLAAFGAESSQEDDAERAVRAGLDLLAQAQVQAARVEREHGQAGFGVRVGVHTGGVLLGGGVDEEGTIRGFTVNIAARLEQAAPPGSLRISQDTWHHVRGIFDMQAQPPLQVKGQDEPLVTYLVLAAKPRAFRAADRGIQGLATPLVGRRAELALLTAAFGRCAAGAGLQSVTVVAEAGLGKSRLMAELQHHIDAQPQPCWLLLGRSQPGSQQQPYGLLRDLLAWRLQITEGGSAESARDQLLQGVRPFFAADGVEAALRQAELLGQLIGMDFASSPRLAGLIHEPRLLRNAALAAFASLLERMAASDGSRVVMMLDDLQWADEASLDALQQLASRSDLPLLLVMGARPGLLERRPAWGQGGTGQQLLRLAPLDAAERQAFSQALLGRLAELPPALLALVDGQAEGNPFYAEELVQMLIDDGVIDARSDPWQLQPGRLAGARIPSTLVGVLQARLDTLAGPERRAAQLASIVGPVFWDDALQALDPAGPAALPALQRKAFVQPRRDSTFVDTREQAFHHHLLHQVTYDTLLKADRRAGHAHAAQWLAGRVGDRQAEYLAVTAEHYARAGDAQRALSWFGRAANAAIDRFANTDALHYLGLMLAMPELGETPERWRLARQQASVADLIGDRALQAQANDECLRLAERLDDDAARASTLAAQAILADRLGELPRARTLAERAVEIAERCDNAAAAALGHGELSWLARLRGDLPAAHRHIERALPHAALAAQRRVERNDHALEVSLRLVAAALHETEHDNDRAGELTRQALVMSEQRQLRRLQAACHGELGAQAINWADAETALDHALQLAAIGTEIGMPEHTAWACLLRAQACLLQGRLDAAIAPLLESIATYGRVGGRFSLAGCHLLHAEWLALRADPAGELAALQTAVGLYTAVGNDDNARACRLLIAEARCRAGEVALAWAAVQAELPAIDTPGALDAATPMLQARVAVWRVLRAAGDARADHHLGLAMADLQRLTEKIRDPARRWQVLTALPLHREISSAWAALPASRRTTD